jgi:hypothetical protein
MTTRKKYTRELKKQFGYLPTWLPGTPLELGDIGVIRKNTFTKISNLSDFGINFQIEQDPTKSDIEYSSKGAVSITTKASGTVAPQNSVLGDVDAGIIVEFSKDDAILFKIKGTTSPVVSDQIEVGKQILALYKEGKWDKDWVVVMEKVDAESGTILISSSSNGKVELKASGEVKTANLDIADADLGFELSYSKDLSTKIVAEKGLTPLFKASKVKTRWFLPPVFKTSSRTALKTFTPEMIKNDDNYLFFGDADFDLDDDLD